jgi:hypothetical protein
MGPDRLINVRSCHAINNGDVMQITTASNARKPLASEQIDQDPEVSGVSAARNSSGLAVAVQRRPLVSAVAQIS